MIDLDGFRELAPIGHGGLGDVYRAVRESTGSAVAIKVLRDVSDSSVAWHRTRRELTALVALSGHAHVIQLHELLDLPVGPALVMEYAPGGSVAALIDRRGGTLTVPEIVLTARQAAAALVAAHERGIVHRDLKPQNLLIDAYGQIKLCDFGIASLARSDEFGTRTSALSMRYASPEDLDEDAAVGPASDVYSLGATMLHLAHGAPPTLKDRLAPWQPPATDDAELARLDEVIAACLRPDPDDRPSAGELTERLDALDAELGSRCRALPVEPIVPTSEPNVMVDDQSPQTTEDDRPEPEPPSSRWFGDDTSAPTVLRHDRVQPPDPQPSEGEPKRRRWPWVAGALGAAAVVGVGLALVWPNDAAAPTATPTTATTTGAAATATTDDPTATADSVDAIARPEGLTSLDGDDVVWPFGPVGECLVLPTGASELITVECSRPHDLQRFAVDDLDTVDFPDGGLFDAEAVRVATDDACRAAFVDFVGVPADASMFQIAVTRPSAETWPDGDRRFQCLLGIRDQYVVGDAASDR